MSISELSYELSNFVSEIHIVFSAIERSSSILGRRLLMLMWRKRNPLFLYLREVYLREILVFDWLRAGQYISYCLVFDIALFSILPCFQYCPVYWCSLINVNKHCFMRNYVENLLHVYEFKL